MFGERNRQPVWLGPPPRRQFQLQGSILSSREIRTHANLNRNFSAVLHTKNLLSRFETQRKCGRNRQRRPVAATTLIHKRHKNRCRNLSRWCFRSEEHTSELQSLRHLV